GGAGTQVDRVGPAARRGVRRAVVLDRPADGEGVARLDRCWVGKFDVSDDKVAWRRRGDHKSRGEIQGVVIFLCAAALEQLADGAGRGRVGDDKEVVRPAEVRRHLHWDGDGVTAPGGQPAVVLEDARPGQGCQVAVGLEVEVGVT